jgi:hypothetical protein
MRPPRLAPGIPGRRISGVDGAGRPSVGGQGGESDEGRRGGVGTLGEWRLPSTARGADRPAEGGGYAVSVCGSKRDGPGWRWRTVTGASTHATSTPGRRVAARAGLALIPPRRRCGSSARVSLRTRRGSANTRPRCCDVGPRGRTAVKLRSRGARTALSQPSATRRFEFVTSPCTHTGGELHSRTRAASHTAIAASRWCRAGCQTPNSATARDVSSGRRHPLEPLHQRPQLSVAVGASGAPAPDLAAHATRPPRCPSAPTSTVVRRPLREAVITAHVRSDRPTQRVGDHPLEGACPWST